jgi:hypothetical protein
MVLRDAAERDWRRALRAELFSGFSTTAFDPRPRTIMRKQSTAHRFSVKPTKAADGLSGKHYVATILELAWNLLETFPALVEY